MRGCVPFVVRVLFSYFLKQNVVLMQLQSSLNLTLRVTSGALVAAGFMDCFKFRLNNLTVFATTLPFSLSHCGLLTLQASDSVGVMSVRHLIIGITTRDDIWE